MVYKSIGIDIGKFQQVSVSDHLSLSMSILCRHNKALKCAFFSQVSETGEVDIQMVDSQIWIPAEEPISNKTFLLNSKIWEICQDLPIHWIHPSPLRGYKQGFTNSKSNSTLVIRFQNSQVKAVISFALHCLFLLSLQTQNSVANALEMSKAIID